MNPRPRAVSNDAKGFGLEDPIAAPEPIQVQAARPCRFLVIPVAAEG
jgi:hypothetical protein